MTIFARYRCEPEPVPNRATGELIEHTARLIISGSLLCVEGLFADPRGTHDAEPLRPRGDWYDGKDDALDRDSLDRDDQARAKRGKITEFSRQSQARLMKRLGCWEPLGGVYILTLTYPREFPDVAEAQEDFNRFRRLMRRDQPDLAGLWKLEYQARGAPHYHMVVQSGSALADVEALRTWVNEAWKKARGSLVPARTQFDAARDPDRARFYLAKEVGKMVQSTPIWREGIAQVEHCGRFWGWHNKTELRFAASVVTVSAHAAWRFRRRVQEVVSRSLVERGLLKFGEAGELLQRDGTPMDEDAIPSWQLHTNSRAIARKICDDLRADGVDIPAFDDWPIAEAPF